MAQTTALSIVQPKSIEERADVLAILDLYVAEMQSRVAAGEISPETWSTYHAGVDRFVDYAHSHREVDGDMLRGWIAWLRQQKYTPSSINTWLTGVRSFLNWAEAKRLTPYNPARDVKGARRRGSKTQHKRDRLSDSEVLRVLALPDNSDAGKRDRAYLMLRAYTAVRDIELHRADVGDIRTRDSRTVLYVHGKGHAEADDLAVLVPEAEHALRNWLAARAQLLHAAKCADPGAIFISLSDRSLGERLSRRAIRWMVKRYFSEAGIVGSDKTSHSMRHAAISSVLDHGGTVIDAQTLARHENVATTGIYVHQKNRMDNPPEDLIDYGKSK